QLHVAEAHAFNSAPPQIDDSHSVEKRSADHRAERRIGQREHSPGKVRTHRQLNSARQNQREQIVYGHYQAEDQAQSQAGEREFVGKQVRFSVSENQAKQQKSEYRAFERCQRKAQVPVAKKEERAGK